MSYLSRPYNFAGFQAFHANILSFCYSVNNDPLFLQVWVKNAVGSHIGMAYSFTSRRAFAANGTLK